MPLPLLAEHRIWQMVQMHPLSGLLIPATTGGNDVQMGIVVPMPAMGLDHDDIAALQGSATDPAEDIIQPCRQSCCHHQTASLWGSGLCVIGFSTTCRSPNPPCHRPALDLVLYPPRPCILGT